MAPPEAAQEGSQGGRGLDDAADGASRPSSAQHVGVVNAVSPGQCGGHQRQHLVAGVGSAWGIAQVEVLFNQLGQAEVLGQGGQPGNGQQAVFVEDDTDAVRVIAW